MSNGTVAATAAHPVHRDPIGAKTGMWLFLFTELLLFGGLFVIYAVYRNMHGESFHHAAAELNVAMGVTNTVVLLTSSLTMVLAVSALQRGRTGRALGMLGATMVASVTFMVIKFFEWSAKYHHQIFPGQDHLREMPHGEDLFFNLYFMMTGLHGIHVVIGLIVMIVVFFKIKGGGVNAERPETLEFTGLYWHLVDLVWIFLLPLFYLTA
ncbi:cytochrome c oxidase subunit 3 family protein [bacterium]|nr:MAG: cytochrome c oxidase subunit 3 family protein [bacterium]